MGSFLMVGRLPDHVERDDAVAYLRGATDAALTSDAQAALLQAWYATPEDMAYFDALNDASKTAFLNHAAKLEGLKDSSEVQKRSRWRHLPHWIESYWLPVRSDTTTGGPVFFGSAHGLLANLADIAATSPHGLGAVPPHFKLMRTHPRHSTPCSSMRSTRRRCCSGCGGHTSRQPRFPSSGTSPCGAARTGSSTGHDWGSCSSSLVMVDMNMSKFEVTQVAHVCAIGAQVSKFGGGRECLHDGARCVRSLGAHALGPSP